MNVRFRLNGPHLSCSNSLETNCGISWLKLSNNRVKHLLSGCFRLHQETTLNSFDTPMKGLILQVQNDFRLPKYLMRYIPGI